MTQQTRGLAIGLGLLIILCAVPRAADAKPGRDVQLIWDLTVSDESRLSVVVDKGDPLRGPAAYGFVLRPEDHVVLVFKWKEDGGTPDITYAVTGTNLDAKDLDKLKGLIGAAAPAAGTRAALADREVPRMLVKPVTDDLIAGGRLTMTMTLKGKEGQGQSQKEVTTYTSGGITFRIEPRPPRLTVSTGIAGSNAPEPAVAIIKTSNIVTFVKDNKTQQAYEQQIVIKNGDASLQPIQAAITLANFRLVARLYASFGVQLNEKIFEEPIAGFTYRHPITGSLGVNFTGGVIFSRETAIIESSGFSDGMKLDPTLGLTVDDIPTEPRYHRRFTFALSVDF